MNAKQFAKLVDRDSHCLHCGEVEAISPNHRINRQMGGSKKRDGTANLVILCSQFNGLIESNAQAAAMAKRYGWKLESWQDPLEIPVTDLCSGVAYLLDNDYGRTVLVARREQHERNEDLPA